MNRVVCSGCILVVTAVCLALGGACDDGARHQAPIGGQGGSGGQGGAGGQGGESCQQLRDVDYLNAVIVALACDPGAVGQCQQRTLLLDCTSCFSNVQDPSGPDAIRAQLVARGCVTPGDCLCLSAGPVTCVASAGGAGGGTCN